MEGHAVKVATFRFIGHRLLDFLPYRQMSILSDRSFINPCINRKFLAIWRYDEYRVSLADVDKADPQIGGKEGRDKKENGEYWQENSSQRATSTVYGQWSRQCRAPD